jgi:hypothetical protein
MTTASAPRTRTIPTTDTRAALVTTSLCVSAGVHAALAAMHADGTTTAEFILFEAAALAALLTIVLFSAAPRIGSWVAIAMLTSMSATYLLSRAVDLPVFGQQPLDLLGMVTVGAQLSGAALAVTIARGPVRAHHAPLVICALIVAYSFLATYAIPSVHHSSHATGHSHASST